MSGRLPSIPRLGARKPRDRDTLRCVRDNVPLVPADGRVRARALPALPYSSARCSAATEDTSIAHPPRIERQGDAAGGEPDPRRVVAQSAVPRVRPSDHTGCSLVRVVQMASESRVGRQPEKLSRLTPSPLEEPWQAGAPVWVRIHPPVALHMALAMSPTSIGRLEQSSAKALVHSGVRSFHAEPG